MRHPGFLNSTRTSAHASTFQRVCSITRRDAVDAEPGVPEASESLIIVLAFETE